MKHGSIIRTTAAALALAAVLGCGPEQTDDWLVVGPNSGQGDVNLYRDVQFADIPVPAEYRVQPLDSYSFQGSRFRQAQIRYAGPLGTDEAMRFYESYLPAAGWRHVRTDFGYDPRVLYYAKGQEQLIVIVRPVQGGSLTEIQLDNIDKNDLLLKGKLSEPRYK